MKAKELKEKNEKDLKKILEEKRIAVRDFRFGVAGSQARNTKEGRNNKKVIARILTELRTRDKTRSQVDTK